MKGDPGGVTAIRGVVAGCTTGGFGTELIGSTGLDTDGGIICVIWLAGNTRGGIETTVTIGEAVTLAETGRIFGVEPAGGPPTTIPPALDVATLAGVALGAPTLPRVVPPDVAFAVPRDERLAAVPIDVSAVGGTSLSPPSPTVVTEPGTADTVLFVSETTGDGPDATGALRVAAFKPPINAPDAAAPSVTPRFDGMVVPCLEVPSLVADAVGALKLLTATAPTTPPAPAPAIPAGSLPSGATAGTLAADAAPFFGVPLVAVPPTFVPDTFVPILVFDGLGGEPAARIPEWTLEPVTVPPEDALLPDAWVLLAVGAFGTPIDAFGAGGATTTGLIDVGMIGVAAPASDIEAPRISRLQPDRRPILVMRPILFQ